MLRGALGLALWIGAVTTVSASSPAANAPAPGRTTTDPAGFAASVKLLSDEIARTADLGEMKIVSDCTVHVSWYAWGGSLVAMFSFADMRLTVHDDYDPVEDIDVMGLTCSSPGCVASLSMRGFPYQDDLFEFSVWHDAQDAVKSALLRALAACGANGGVR